MKTEKQELLDYRYLRMARVWAENSYCKRRKVGALVVKQKMIISAGLGTHSVNLRLNNQPQLVVIDIVNTQQGQESKV